MIARIPGLLFILLQLTAPILPVAQSAAAQESGVSVGDLPQVSEGTLYVSRRERPIKVAVGIEVDQITSVDQKAENYGAVVAIRMKWHDPALAFEDTQGTGFRQFKPEDLVDHAKALGSVVPRFVVQNQQSNRWIHEDLAVVLPDGTAFYAEKSSLTLQAPHFDFTRYPFDRQSFYFKIVSAYPDDVVTFAKLPLDSGLDSTLGEEEWVLSDASMEIGTTKGLTGLDSSSATLTFTGSRHVTYYTTRLFLPMLILVVVSWAAFFLDDYRKRAEIAGANLLVFVAFNWTISSDLPKLGYVTFVDFILQWMFIVTGLLIVFNVVLTRLQVAGRQGLATRLDNYAIKWIYPLGYAAIVVVAVTNFLLTG